MKRWLGLLAVLVGLLPLAVQAQVAMEIALNHYNYLRFEPVQVRVALRNDSGRPLVFGEDKRLQGRLHFEITDSRNLPLQLRGTKDPSLTGMILKAGESKVFTLPLSDFYPLTASGTYRVYAWLSHPQLVDNYQSNQVIFTVSEGNELWRIPVGEPDVIGENTSKPIKTKYYVLNSIFEKSRRVFYLQVEDQKKIYAMRRIGYEVGSEKIEHDVDSLSTLHLIVPVSAKMYHYLTIDLNGKVGKVEVYKKDKWPPRLGRDEKHGRVFVVGGEKAIEGVDYSVEKAPLKADGSR